MVYIAAPAPAAACSSTEARARTTRMRWQSAGRLVLAALPRIWSRLQHSRTLAPEANTDAVPGHHDYLRKLRVGVTANGRILTRSLTTSRVRTSAAAAQHVMASGAIQLERSEDETEVAFHLQGDASLHTEEAMRQRLALRTHPGVVAALQRYWDAALCSLMHQVERGSGAGVNEGGGSSRPPVLHREGYAIMLRRLYRVMMGAWDADDAERAIAEDWANDARGGETLTRELFMDALVRYHTHANPLVDTLMLATPSSALLASIASYKHTPAYGPTGRPHAYHTYNNHMPDPPSAMP